GRSPAGTKRTTTLCPLARSNAGARSLIPDTLPMPASTVISAACRESMLHAVTRLSVSIQVRSLISTSLCCAGAHPAAARNEDCYDQNCNGRGVVDANGPRLV